MSTPNYEDWDEPILENGLDKADRRCKSKAQHYSSPGHKVEHIATEREPESADIQQANWRCKFRTHHFGEQS